MKNILEKTSYAYLLLLQTCSSAACFRGLVVNGYFSFIARRQFQVSATQGNILTILRDNHFRGIINSRGPIRMRITTVQPHACALPSIVPGL